MSWYRPSDIGFAVRSKLAATVRDEASTLHDAVHAAEHGSTTSTSAGVDDPAAASRTSSSVTDVRTTPS